MSNRMTRDELTQYTAGAKSLPAEYGTMEVFGKKSRSDIIYYDWNFSFNRDISAERDEDQGVDEVQVIFNLNQDIEWKKRNDYTDEEELVPMKRGEACIYRYKNESTSMVYKGGVRFKFKSLQMTTRRFEKYLKENFPGDKAGQIRKQVYSRVQKTVITPEMYRVLLEIDSAERYEDFSPVFLEGKMLELTGLVLYGVFHKDEVSVKEPIKMDKRDTLLMEKLREDIQMKPAEDYSMDGISTRLGISKSKLSKMFNDMYGISIHGYVLDQRLEYAAILFKSGYHNVTEVATRSGYNNMSYFAREFAKKFGTTPKNYSKIICQ